MQRYRCLWRIHTHKIRAFSARKNIRCTTAALSGTTHYEFIRADCRFVESTAAPLHFALLGSHIGRTGRAVGRRPLVTGCGLHRIADHVTRTLAVILLPFRRQSTAPAATGQAAAHPGPGEAGFVRGPGDGRCSVGSGGKAPLRNIGDEVLQKLAILCKLGP